MNVYVYVQAVVDTRSDTPKMDFFTITHTKTDIITRSALVFPFPLKIVYGIAYAEHKNTYIQITHNTYTHGHTYIHTDEGLRLTTCKTHLRRSTQTHAHTHTHKTQKLPM